MADLGFLTDKQIGALLDAGELIEKGTWEKASIRHASYTLRLGHRVEVIRAAQAREVTRHRLSITLTTALPQFELQPGDSALLYSQENLRIPSDVIAFTVARGLLFVEALAPENTYVDPGFSGQLYTTVINLSSRIVPLKFGMPIARLFFYRLSEAVADNYSTGPAKGIEQSLSSRPLLTSVPALIPSESRSNLRTAILTERSGPEIVEAIRRVENLAVTAAATAVLWPAALYWANNSPKLLLSIGQVASNIVVTLASAAIIFAGQKLWKKFRGA